MYWLKIVLQRMFCISAENRVAHKVLYIGSKKCCTDSTVSSVYSLKKVYRVAKVNS